MSFLEGLLWLTLNIYHEARSEPQIGQLAVAHVTLNRAAQKNKSVEEVVSALEQAGLKVNHPSLLNHPHNDRYKEFFEVGCGTLFTIDLGSKEAAFAFLDRVEIPVITANIGDSRTLALHMASTIYRDFSKEEWEFLGITEGLVRISVGLENPADIIDDFLGAYSGNAE